MRRAQLQPYTFDAIDSAIPTALKSGLNFSAGEVQISKDRGAFVNVANLPVEISAGTYGADLTAAETNASWVHVRIIKAGMYPQRVGGFTGEQPTAAVVADAGNSATTFVTSLTQVQTDFWAGMFVRFQTGALAGQARKITGYNGTTKALSFGTGFASTPAASDVFAIVND